MTLCEGSLVSPFSNYQIFRWIPLLSQESTLEKLFLWAFMKLTTAHLFHLGLSLASCAYNIPRRLRGFFNYKFYVYSYLISL